MIDLKFEDATPEALRGHAALLAKVSVLVERCQRALGWYVAGNAEPEDWGLHLEWGFGKGINGYFYVREEVQAIVAERMEALVAEAKERIELRARKAFDEALK